MKNPKNKGNTFERLTAEKLSLWLTNGKEKRAAWRTDTSGGAATVWSKKKQEARYVKANMGDIKKVAESGLYPDLDTFFDTFVVECKHYRQIEFYPPFNKILIKFLDTCILERDTTGKKAVLILKANNRQILYCQEATDYTPNAKPYFSITYKSLVLNIYLFDEIVKENDYIPKIRATNQKCNTT